MKYILGCAYSILSLYFNEGRFKRGGLHFKKLNSTGCCPEMCLCTLIINEGGIMQCLQVFLKFDSILIRHFLHSIIGNASGKWN